MAALNVRPLNLAEESERHAAIGDDNVCSS